MKLSSAQYVALLWALGHGGGKLLRWPGGFWTIPEMEKQKRPLISQAVPVWHTSTNTVMAMERWGLVRRLDQDYAVEHWRADRIVTDAGRLALAEAAAHGAEAQAREKWNLVKDLDLFSGWKTAGAAR